MYARDLAKTKIEREKPKVANLFERLVIKPSSGYFKFVFYGFTKEANELDFMVSFVAGIPIWLLCVVVPMWLILDVL
jgi:hypothetical protein